MTLYANAIAGNVFRFRFAFGAEPDAPYARVMYLGNGGPGGGYGEGPVELDVVPDAADSVEGRRWAYYADFGTAGVVDFGRWVVQTGCAGSNAGAKERVFMVLEPRIR